MCDCGKACQGFSHDINNKSACNNICSTGSHVLYSNSLRKVNIIPPPPSLLTCYPLELWWVTVPSAQGSNKTRFRFNEQENIRVRAIDLGAAAAADRPQDALDVAASPLERGSQPATGDQRTRCALGSRIELSCVHACTLRVSKRKKK